MSIHEFVPHPQFRTCKICGREQYDLQYHTLQVTPPKPIDTAEEATQEKCYICESSIEWPDDNDPSLAGKTSVAAKCGHYFRKRHPSPQAEPSESAGEKDIGVDNPNHYEILKFMNEALVKTHPSEQSHAYRVSKYALLKASQPSTQSQPSIMAEGAKSDLEQTLVSGFASVLTITAADEAEGKRIVSSWKDDQVREFAANWIARAEARQRLADEAIARLRESQPSSLAGNDNHFLYASQYAGVTFDQAAAVAVALVNKGWNAARQQSQPAAGSVRSYDDCSMSDAQAAEQYAIAYVCEVGVSRETMIDAISTLRAQVMAYESASAPQPSTLPQSSQAPCATQIAAEILILAASREWLAITKPVDQVREVAAKIYEWHNAMNAAIQPLPQSSPQGAQKERS